MAHGEQVHNSKVKEIYLSSHHTKEQVSEPVLVRNSETTITKPVATQLSANSESQNKFENSMPEGILQNALPVSGNTLQAIKKYPASPPPTIKTSIEQPISGVPRLNSRWESWKKQLLDLSKRNQMINYRPTKLGTLKILEPGFIELFNRLAIDEVELTFQRPIDKDSDIKTFAMLSLLKMLAYPINVDIGDIKAEGSYQERKKTIENLRSKSKLARDEQGANILYLSFGFIEWRETNSAEPSWVKSPVLMMPVSVKHESLRGPFVLARYNDEIEVNPTLDYLFNERYGVDLPTFELNSPESIEEYMQTIQEIADKNGWKLTLEVSLGLVSFTKISMYHDINNNYDRIIRNPVIRAIARCIDVNEKLGSELIRTDIDQVPPKDCFQVLNSDSSQQEAILLSKAGVSFVMQGPPGTGKSQTITNIIAEAFADGKKVLFVSEKLAALEVVYRRLAEVGLSDFCLALHSHKANKKEILDNIAANLKPERTRIKDSILSELEELFLDRQFLNQYVKELHEDILPFEMSLYRAFGEMLSLNCDTTIDFKLTGPELISASEYNKMLYSVEAYAKAIGSLGIPISQNPWLGTNVTAVNQEFKNKLFHSTQGLASSLLEIDKIFSAVTSSFRLREENTWNGIQRVVSLLDAFEKLPLFPKKWTDISLHNKLLQQAKNAKQEKSVFLDAMNTINHFFNDSILNVALTEWLESAKIKLDNIRNTLNTPKRLDKEILSELKTYAQMPSNLIPQIDTLVEAFQRANSLLRLNLKDTYNSINCIRQLATFLINSLPVKSNWFDPIEYSIVKRLLSNALQHIEQLNAKTDALLQDWEVNALSIDADAILSRFKTEYNSAFKMLKPSYHADKKTIKAVSKNIGGKLTDNDIIRFLQALKEITSEKNWFYSHDQQLTNCFGRLYHGEDTDWILLNDMLSLIDKLSSFFPNSIVPKSIIDLVCDRSAHVSEIEEFAKLALHLNESNLIDIFNGITSILSYIPESSLSEDILPRIKNLASISCELLDMVNLINFHMKDQLPIETIIEKISSANIALEAKNKMIQRFDILKELFDSLFQNIETNWDTIIFEIESVSTILSGSYSCILTDEFLIAACGDKNTRNLLITTKNNLVNLCADITDTLKAFTDLFNNSNNLYNMKLDELSKKVSFCLNNLTLLDNWLICLETKATCDNNGLADFISKLNDQDLNPDNIINLFKYGFFSNWINSVISTKKTVEQFRRHIHDEKIEHFVSLDVRQLYIARERVKQIVVNNVPDPNQIRVADDEYSKLQSEMNKRRGVMPLRKLFKSIPNLLLKLKPCMMMSPLSVAYFLEAQSYEFDMVIFDEASQIFPQDAIGAISRGKQIIIAGDIKQLPPSNFFSTATRHNEDDLDDDNEDDDESYEIYDSILEETTGVLPNRYLLWHYRSKHESLIAFSNQDIYKNELITFPSSIETFPDTGVEFVFAEEGVYEGGGLNTGEARRCVQLVWEHIQRHPNRSLGIIAFSLSQQKAILNEIYKFREQHPEFEFFFIEDKHEEFFVKNLENVQGDERDTIIFSISYGKTKDQRDNNRPMSLRFGPLGQKGGERRLNVAITRAKHNVKLVSSILPSDIDLSRTDSEGIRMLRSYIDFAIKGPITINQPHSVDESDVFLIFLCEFLVSRGYKIKKFVGCSGYKIDIAVLHPEKENYFVVGIECDGISYAMARTARDRDHLRKSVLEAMGWKIYRVWSSEWKARPDIESQKLLDFIANSINAHSGQTGANHHPPTGSPRFSPEDFVEFMPDETPLPTSQITNNSTMNLNPFGFDYYEEALWSETPALDNYDESTKYSQMIKYIISVEQPISDALLYQRMAGAYGNQKATAPIRRNVDGELNGPFLKNIIHKDKFGFITLSGFSELKVRIPRPDTKSREANCISPDEIGLAMYTVASMTIGISKEELIVTTARAFGYTRRGERVAASMDLAIELLVNRGKVKIVDDKVTVIGEANHRG